jgi:hypothetical protein
MNANSQHAACAAFPIRDYEQLEAELNTVRLRLTALQPQHAAMTEELDRITRPEPHFAAAAVKTIHRGFAYRGTISVHRTCIGVHLALLRRLWSDFPDCRQAMAEAMISNSRSRRYVAPTSRELFRAKSAGWAERHSRHLLDGWYADTNLNPGQMHTILAAAVAATGLQWGQDVKVYWRPTPIHARLDTRGSF